MMKLEKFTQPRAGHAAGPKWGTLLPAILAPILVPALLAITPQASAATLDPYNTRPVPVTIPSPDGPGRDLQTILSVMFPLAGLDVLADQSHVGMWQSSIASVPLGLTTLAFEYAGNARNNSFGVWSMDALGTVTRAEIFRGTATPGATALLYWADMDTVQIVGGRGTRSGLFDGIDPLRFGFYTGNGSGTYYYTMDALNPGGMATALAYNSPGTDWWALAFEDVGSTDADFNDLVVRASLIETSAVQPVPLPAAAWLLASGLAGLAGLGARRRKADAGPADAEAGRARP